MNGWSGIPRKYHPRGKNWRLTWGIGCFQDFDTLKEAQAAHARYEARGTELLDEPFYVNHKGAFFAGEPEYEGGSA